MYLSIYIIYIYIYCIYSHTLLQSQMKRLLLRISTNQPSGFSLFLLTCYTSKLSELQRLLYVQWLIYLFLQTVWGDSFLWKQTWTWWHGAREKSGISAYDFNRTLVFSRYCHFRGVWFKVFYKPAKKILAVFSWSPPLFQVNSGGKGTIQAVDIGKEKHLETKVV